MGRTEARRAPMVKPYDEKRRPEGRRSLVTLCFVSARVHAAFTQSHWQAAFTHCWLPVQSEDTRHEAVAVVEWLHK